MKSKYRVTAAHDAAGQENHTPPGQAAVVGEKRGRQGPDRPFRGEPVRIASATRAAMVNR